MRESELPNLVYPKGVKPQTPPRHVRPAEATKVSSMLRLLFCVSFIWSRSPRRPWPRKCGGDFHAFLAEMAREAQAAGVSRAVIDQAFAGLTLDQAVLAFDRRQRGMFHSKSFEEYAPPASSRPASSAPRR